jgi:hypothetical protein
VLGAAAVFVAAGAPYVGRGTEADAPGTPTFFYAWGVDLGATSLLVVVLLVGAALSLPRGARKSALPAAGRLLLGLMPTAFALLHLLPRPEPEPTRIMTMTEPGQEPILSWGPPYPCPWIPESEPLLTALGLALLVAVAYSWGAARTSPEVALATALVLVTVAWPLAWTMHGYAVWPHIVIPLGAALALTLRAAHAAHRPSSATPASSSEPAASR